MTFPFPRPAASILGVPTLRAALLAGCALLAVAPAFAAVPLAVPFLPPEVDQQATCIPRPPGNEVVARWSAWDGGALDNRSTVLIRRDLRVLRELDAVAWADTIEAAISRLQETDPAYGESDALMDRIELVRTADGVGQPAEQALVERFLALGDVEPTPGAQAFAANLYLDGVSVPADEARGRALLVEAAYGGHSESLLQLAAITSDGTVVEGWDIAPELAVTLAFGALVGEVDPLICDRINRIASAYRVGEVVAQDIPLAEQWYRLGSDFGDFNSAWQVAQLHLRAEGLEKDNDVLLAQMEQAAAGGLTYAQVELGRILETGALVPRDLDRARALYEQAAAAGDQQGLVRLAFLLADLEAPTPADLERRAGILRQLVAAPVPPVWALIELGDAALAEKGRWAGEGEAAALYRRALQVEPGQPLATTRLVETGLRAATTTEEVLALTSQLQQMVLSTGDSAAVDQIIDIFACRSPEAPHVEHADYWRRIREQAGNLTVDMDPADLRALGEAPDPALTARIQSQALSGRSSAYALLVALQDETGFAMNRQVMASLSRGADSGPLTEVAKSVASEARAARDEEARAEAVALLREAIAAGEGGAREQLLTALTDDDEIAPENEAEVVALSLELAAEGKGRGLEAMVLARGGDQAARDAVWAEYRNVIEANGDFDAILLSLPYLAASEPDVVEDRIARARASMPCNTSSAIRMAEAMHGLGRADEVERWIAVAHAAAQGEGRLLVNVADAIGRLSARPDARTVAVDLLMQARAGGDRLALLRLLSMARDEETPLDLPPEQMADLFVEVVAASDPLELSPILRRIQRADPEVRALVEERVDIRANYVAAAEAGDALAQLELARMIQAEAQGQDDLAEVARLLTASAEQGQAEAMYLLSTAYSFGLGVEPSLETSRSWLVRAAEAGHEEAQTTVTLLRAQGVLP